MVGQVGRATVAPVAGSGSRPCRAHQAVKCLRSDWYARQVFGALEASA